jgi:UDP-2,3-diacylglucosamine pyrophosphatase LpxH
MLAIISDLHLGDRSAVENVDPDAFKLALGDVYGEAGRLARRLDREVDLTLVLLGDAFDLLRTERWLEVPVADRPYGSAAALDGARPSPSALAQAGKILDDILETNARALATLSGKDPAPPPGVAVRRVLLPGNHDRVALHDDGLYARMRAAVDAVDEGALSGEGIHRHRLEMPAYGLLARHGHEWDPWNFASFDPHAHAHYDDAQYLAAPIGDAIATELAARLPFEVKQRLAGVTAFSPDEKDEIYTHLQGIENVRPALASLQWVYQEAERLGRAYGDAKVKALRAALDDTVQTLAKSFLELDFYRAWHDRHSSIFHPFSMAAEVHAALEALTVVRADTLGHAGERLGALGAPRGNPLRAAALAGAKLEDLTRVGSKDLRFVVYGHTHEADLAPLDTRGTADDLYLNTGTFRHRVLRTDDARGFIASEVMTYLYFYREDEAAAWRGRASTRSTASSGPGRSGPAYAAWTGMRSR